MPPIVALLDSLVRAVGSRAALAVALMVLVAATEGISLVLLVPILGLVGVDVQEGATGHLSRALAAVFAAANLPPTLPAALAVFVLAVVLRALLHNWETRVGLALEYEFTAHLRERFYRAIAGAAWPHLARRRSSDLVHALTEEIDRVGDAAQNLLYLTGSAIVFCVYAALALRLSWQTTALAFVCGLALLVLLRRRVAAAYAVGERLSAAGRGIYAAAVEHLGAMKTVKSYGAERRSVEIFTGRNREAVSAYRSVAATQTGVKFWFDAGTAVILSVVVFGAREMAGVSTATLLLLIFLIARTVPRLGMMQQVYQGFLTMLPAFENVMRLQRECEAAAENPPALPEEVELRKEIRFEGVSFRYRSGDAPAVEDLDLVIPAGRTTGLVGPSGAGKSTVADLVMGLLLPDAGRVLVDGRPLSHDRMRAWRSKIGYVPQDGLLFHDTVRANLSWARPDATENELHEALRAASADEFVSRLPHGLDTLVGDRGVLISAGERQRLMLARALLRRPALLLLDEATADLDLENERRILRAIDALKGRLTVLLITHRLSAARHADVIYVLDRGLVAESGRWDDLMSGAGGRLRALAEAGDTLRETVPLTRL